MRNIYRIFRSIVVTVVLMTLGLSLLLYVGLSLPSVQNVLRERAEKELSTFLGSDVEIGELQVLPFTQVVVKDLTVYDLSHRKCLQVSRLGAGLDIWKLLWHGDMIFTHAELVGMRATLIADHVGEPLNIQFIINAFKPKNPGQPPAKFDFCIRHVVIRSSAVTFDRLWLPHTSASRMDFNHLSLSDLAADVSLPRMRNDDFTIDLRRLRVKEKSGFSLEKLSCGLHLTPQSVQVKSPEIELPHTSVKLGDITIEAVGGKWNFLSGIEHGRHRLRVEDARLCPADFAALVPDIGRFSEIFTLDIDAEGNLDDVEISRLFVRNHTQSLLLNVRGSVSNLRDWKSLRADVSGLELVIDGSQTVKLVEMLATVQPSVSDLLRRLGHVRLNTKAKISASSLVASLDLASGLGSVKADGKLAYTNRENLALTATASTAGFDVGMLLARADVGSVALDADCNLNIVGGYVAGSLHTDIPFAEYKGKRWQNIVADITRTHTDTQLALNIEDPDAMLNIEGSGSYSADIGSMKLTADVQHLNLGAVPFNTPLGASQLKGIVNLYVTGDNIRNLDGEATLEGFTLDMPGRKPVSLDFAQLRSSCNESGIRTATIHSQYVNGQMTGHFSFARLPLVVSNILAPAFPSFIKSSVQLPIGEYADFRLDISHDRGIEELFNLPVKLLEDVTLHGSFNELSGTMSADIDVPYLLQGRDKLIRDTRLTFLAERESDIYSLKATTTMPSKSNEVTLNLSLDALNDSANTVLGWKVHRKGNFSGDIRLGALLRRNPLDATVEVDANIHPSTFDINDTTWHVSPATIKYARNLVDVRGVRVSSDEQFAAISGRASVSAADSLFVQLRDIDLDYVFSTLGINYVTFGGLASGTLTGTRLFSSHPLAYTDSLGVRGLTYNGGLLGDAVLRSHYDADAAEVTITALINERGKHVATVDGGIWVKRDSLSFGINADKVNIRFMQPFMAAFANSVAGRASGNALLYGTFKDINLRGDLFADTISLGLDFTNTVYSGSDSVHIHPGLIEIPSFRIYDTEGHSAVVNGWVRHNYFHEPSFRFDITGARSLLCYNTNASINPIWYGRVYGNGGASIKGHPGMVNILVDMSTAPKSMFTFVLSDTQEAGEYNFLTFTDRRKAAAEAEQPDTIPPIRRKYMKLAQQNADNPSAYVMDLRATVTPDAEMVLVMDPVAGDKIRAYGNGNLQMGYTSFDEKLTMYGRYVLDRGTYNFSLQDVILKTFTIRPGSSISFNGDPYQAQLNIDGLYRVNTNLTDLDPSFASDRDLNRTNVPVEAVVKVQGDMTQPDISFDIELPSVNEDVARKVKSIISTEDMMSRQIIYLLALNRFYTPEYMGGKSEGNELASIGFSTLSSHLTNILGQLSPNWSFMPNVRTDQGDFSDLEFDLALSSRLFNNKLLLNGNLGYRDRATSSTTFVGDFDLEYLLNRAGSLRLKAYNHFNDQNYYLKSALTTQGLGIIYKHDFDRWFSFLRRRKRVVENKNTKNDNTINADTLLRFKTSKQQ